MVVVLVIMDFFIGEILKCFYFKQKSGLLYRTTYVIDSTRADILIFGSSRANHHYVPSILENKLHQTVYNCGRDGCNLIYHAATISAVLERYSPKQIIIDLTPDELCVSEEGRLSPLLPYYRKKAIFPYVLLNSKFEKFKLLSKTYPFNSILTNIIVGNLAYNKSRYKVDEGYLGLNKVMPYYKKRLFNQKNTINDRVDILDDLLKKIANKGIKVTLIISPSYFSFAKKNDPVIKTFKNLTFKYPNVKFLNYENNSDYISNRLFNDEDHLNDAGARKFSDDVAGKLIDKD